MGEIEKPLSYQEVLPLLSKEGWHLSAVSATEREGVWESDPHSAPGSQPVQRRLTLPSKENFLKTEWKSMLEK